MDLRKYAKQFEKNTRTYRRDIAKYLDKQADIIIDKAKYRTPVDTGFLRSSWQRDRVIVNQSKYLAVFNVNLFNLAHYASYIEFGTYRIMAYNMISVPLTEYYAKVEQDLEDIIAKVYTKI